MNKLLATITGRSRPVDADRPSRRGRTSVAVGVGAGLAALLLAGSPAHAAADGTAGVLGTDAQASVVGATGSFKAGAGTSGEYIWICDTADDGHTTTTYLVWGTSGRAQVSDLTGNDGDCWNFGDLGIPEGTRVGLKVCVDNVRCSGWKYGIA
jgi:hypothetical protein